MSRIKRFLTSSAGTLTLFALAVGLLLFSSVGGARAALTYYSETYTSRVQMYDIGVSLVENGTVVASRDYDTKKNDGSWKINAGQSGVLLGNLLKEGESFRVGVEYPEELAVKNSGTINQYVRVNLYRYWLDEKGEKLTTLSPDLIDLELDTGGGWILDEEASDTAERTVLYYNRALGAGETSRPFARSLRIDTGVAASVTQTREETGNGTKITTTYDYDGVCFYVEATVDAVQEHNAQDAILSAWGRRVAVSSGGILSLR